VSGNCAQHQRDVAIAIKTARELALLPYATRVTSSRGGGRGGGGGRGRDRDDRGPREGREGARPGAEDAAPEGDVDADVVLDDLATVGAEDES
jgi:small subunit ribosomal protein S18